MVKVAENKRPATSFLQPLVWKEEPACERCGLSVAQDADAFMYAGSGFFKSYHPMYEAKVRDK